MDYSALASEFLGKMQLLQRARPHKEINEALHGGFFVLHYIMLQGGDVLPGEISQEMGVSSARVAAALNGLEGKGLITRRIDQNDRRKILVGLTREGKDLAERQYYGVRDEAARMLALLGEADAVEYVRLTGKLTENMMSQGETKPCCN